jgi:hypothetical protein
MLTAPSLPSKQPRALVSSASESKDIRVFDPIASIMRRCILERSRWAICRKQS